MPSNFARTGMLLIVLTAIFAAMGSLVGGRDGLIIAFIVALATNAFAFWKSDSVVLKMFKAREVTAADAPQLHQLVANLAERAQLPMPRVYLVDSPQPNAFATGRNPQNAAVAVSMGLVDSLSWEELAGVVAHELAHVRNRDTLTMTMAATIAGAISMFANFLQFGMLFGGNRQQGGVLGWIRVLAAVLVAPFAAMLVQMAISRSREYEADRVGSYLCGEPRWLASALGKIHAAVARQPMQEAEMMPAAAHLFIVNPLTGRGLDSLFTTHPNIENRIAELQKLAQEFRMAGTAAPQPIDIPGASPTISTTSWEGPFQQGRPDFGNERGPGHGPWG